MPRIFLSHASEDKKSFVRPLAHALRARGLDVWYDEFSLTVGDSLRRSIDRGLAECDAGVVVLSPAFFAKRWPQAELDALYTLDLTGRGPLLPIWHEIDQSAILSHSPLIADRIALKSSDGFQRVSSAIATKLGLPETHTGGELAEILLDRMSFDDYGDEAFSVGCHFRFLQMNAFKQEFGRNLDKLMSALTDEERDDWPAELEEKLEDEQNRLRRKHKIPTNVYLTTDEPVREDNRAWYHEALGEWAAGTLTEQESASLVGQLDYDELDEYYILLGIPNYEVSYRQAALLDAALIEIGCCMSNDYVKIEELAQALSKLDSPKDA